MRLDLERDRDAVAEVEHARVLARPLQHALAGGRQPPQQRRRVLVAAVLRPEEREDGELEVVRVAAEKLPDSIGLPVGEAEGAVERLFRDLRQVIQSSPYTDGPVRRRYVFACWSLSALIWGSSFLFIKVAIRRASRRRR